MTKQIPVYDICTIDKKAKCELLLERFGSYLEKHYQDLHKPHRHSFYHLVLFTKGKGSHTIDFEKFPVKPFQIYFMVPGQVHSWHFEGDVDGYVVHFNAGVIENYLRDPHYLERFSFFHGDAINSVRSVPPKKHDHLVDLFENMLQELSGEKEQFLEVIRLRLVELFITVERDCKMKPQKKFPSQKLTLLRNYQRLIDKHFRQYRLPKEYADLLYVTPNHLNALCNELLGKTAGDLIRDRILIEAKRLLTNAEMTASEIAYDLNFQDNSYFTRFFRKNVGMTPDEFRKKFINE